MGQRSIADVGFGLVCGQCDGKNLSK